jgi:hypothetical protein
MWVCNIVGLNRDPVRTLGFDGVRFDETCGKTKCGEWRAWPKPQRRFLQVPGAHGRTFVSTPPCFLYCMGIFC